MNETEQQAPAMANEQDWDDLADDETQWGEPSDIEPVERVESVASVRLPASVMAEARANARLRGMRIGEFLRYLITQGLATTPGGEVWTPSLTQFYNGYWEAPTQSVWTNTIPTDALTG